MPHGHHAALPPGNRISRHLQPISEFDLRESEPQAGGFEFGVGQLQVGHSARRFSLTYLCPFSACSAANIHRLACHLRTVSFLLAFSVRASNSADRFVSAYPATFAFVHWLVSGAHWLRSTMYGPLVLFASTTIYLFFTFILLFASHRPTDNPRRFRSAPSNPRARSESVNHAGFIASRVASRVASNSLPSAAIANIAFTRASVAEHHAIPCLPS